MKLVRDRIPELAATNGQPGSYHQATEAEYALWLRAKLLEEAQEAVTASPATLVEELGDVLQVLYALAELVGILHGCLARRVAYQEQVAWPTAKTVA